MIHNILFDFDSSFLKKEAIEFLIEIGIQKLSQRELDFRLNSLKSLAARAEANEVSLGYKMSQQLQIAKIFQQDLETTAAQMFSILSPEIEKIIKFLKSHNKNIIIFSRAFEELVHPITDAFEIQRQNVFTNHLLFNESQRVIGVDESKPLFLSNGKVYLAESLQNQGRLVGRTAVVGNSRGDLSIRKGGIADYFIYISNQTAQKELLNEADFVLEHPGQLLPLVSSADYFNSQQISTTTYQSEAAPKPHRAILFENIHSKAKIMLSQAGFLVKSRPNSPDEPELVERASECQIIGIRSKTQLRAASLANCKSILAIGCFCIGTDQVDLTAAANLGIPVFNAPYANTRSVAELVLGEVIMLMRGVFDKSSAAHNGRWLKKTSHSRELRGKTIGIVGYGHIGSQVSILFENLGMQVVFYDIMDKLPLGNAQRMPDLKSVLATADVVTLHVPDTRQTQNMINSTTLNQMKAGSILINSSRGKVVNLLDLRTALESGRLVGAAVDVFPKEPMAGDAPFICSLQKLSNVILTPHIGGSTIEAQEKIASEVSEKLRNFLQTGSTLGAINFPEAELPLNDNSVRILLVHRNVSGVLAKIHNVFSQYEINLIAQILKTRDSIGYMIMDLNRKNSGRVPELLNRITETIKVWKIET